MEPSQSSRWRWSRSRWFYWRCGGMYRVLHGQNVSRVVGRRYSICEEGQNQHPLTNATKWILQYWRLTKPSTGIKPKLMHQLYIAVALPKITYGIDIWYYPPNKQEGHTRNSGSVMFLRNLQKIQCIAALTITGTLRSSPNDYIDIHTNILPLKLALSKACHNAIIHYLTLPETNPIHKLIQNLLNNPPPNKHPSPLYKHLKLYQLTNSQIETIKPLLLNEYLIYY